MTGVIVSARKAAQLSQGELAEKCGWSVDKIGRLERSQARLKKAEAEILAAALDVSVEKLQRVENSSMLRIMGSLKTGSSLAVVFSETGKFVQKPDYIDSEEGYALQVHTSENEPRISVGDLVFCDPSRPVPVGRLANLIIKNNKIMESRICQVIASDSTHVTVATLQDSTQTKIAWATIESLDLIVGAQFY